MGKRANNEGSVRQRPDGTWEGRISLPDGKRKSVYAKTQKECLAKVTQIKADLQKGITPTANDRLTVKGFFTDWLEGTVKTTLRPRSYERYGDTLRLHILPALGSGRLSDLTPQKIEKYMRDKQAEGLSAATVSHHHAVLRSGLSKAVKWGMIHRNPASLASAPRVEQFPAKPFDEGEARQFLQAVKGDRLEALYSVAVSLGLRMGEILGLSWSDVDLEGGRLTVNRNLQRIGGKLTLTEPKTAKSRRSLPLPPALVNALRQHRARQLREQLLAGEAWANADGLIFTTRTGRPMKSAHLLLMFKRLLKRVGIEERRFHDLRHSTATLLLVQGVPMRVVMEVLGHSQIATTANLYSHVTPAVQRDAIEGMSRFLEGSA